MTPSNPIIHCFYHSADLDGHCSGAIVKYRYPKAIMHPINYGDKFPWSEILDWYVVYMVDFSLQPESKMMVLMDILRPGNFHWIDHHKSAIESVPLYYRGMIAGSRDTSKAACELTWEYLFPDRPVPLAVKLLSLYDSWTYQGHELEPMVLPFQMRLRMEDLDPKGWTNQTDPDVDISYPEHMWSNLFAESHFSTSLVSSLAEEGKLLLRYDEEQKRRYVQTYGFDTQLRVVFPSDGVASGNITTYRAIAVNLGHTNSKVFDSVWRKNPEECSNKIEWSDSPMSYLCSKKPMEGNGLFELCEPSGCLCVEPYDLMITFVRRSDHCWNVSLYSTKPEIDCGAIAKSFGGGGHRGAAGFQCEELPFEI